MPPGADWTMALAIGAGLLVVWVVIRVVWKITSTLFTLGCLGLIVLAVLAVLLGSTWLRGTGV